MNVKFEELGKYYDAIQRLDTILARDGDDKFEDMLTAIQDIDYNKFSSETLNQIISLVRDNIAVLYGTISTELLNNVSEPKTSYTHHGTAIKEDTVPYYRSRQEVGNQIVTAVSLAFDHK